MPRPTTPLRSRTPAREVATARGGAGFSRNKEITELRETVKRQEEMIEKQGALLLGHAQLLHEMREELVQLREGGMGGDGGHTKQLTQLTTITLKNMSANIESVQKEMATASHNVRILSQHTGCPIDDKPTSQPPSPLARPTFNTVTEVPAPMPAHMAPPIVAPEEFKDYSLDAMDFAALDDERQTPMKSRDIGTDLYQRGMAQKQKRAHEIAERQRLVVEEARRSMKRPEISHMAKRSKSSDKPVPARTEEWKEKREQKRESLRTEMKKLEEGTLRPSPNLNPNSMKIAAQSGYRRTQSASPKRPDVPMSPVQTTPPSSPLDMSSPPPLDELLERLRKRRELLGLCSSQSPERVPSSSLL